MEEVLHHVAKSVGLSFLFGWVFSPFEKEISSFIYPDFRKLAVHGGNYPCHPENSNCSGCAGILRVVCLETNLLLSC